MARVNLAESIAWGYPKFRMSLEGSAVQYEIQPNDDKPWISVERRTYLDALATSNAEALNVIAQTLDNRLER